VSRSKSKKCGYSTRTELLGELNMPDVLLRVTVVANEPGQPGPNLLRWQRWQRELCCQSACVDLGLQLSSQVVSIIE
jgi:hypothetical protein